MTPLRDRVRQSLGTRLPLVRDIAFTSGARIYSTLLSMLILILSARWLGPEGRGIAVVVTTWVTLGASILSLSLGQICVHRAARENDQLWVGPILSALLVFTLVVTVVGWGIAATAWTVSDGGAFGNMPAAALIIAFAALPFFIWEQFGSALLSILGRLKTYNLSQLIGRTIGVVILFVTIRLLDLGVIGFLIAFTATQFIIAASGVTLLARHLRGKVRATASMIAGLVRDGAKIHVNAIGVMLYSGMDILMLNHFRGAAETGVFQFAMQLFLALLLLPQSALLALQGRLTDRSIDEFWWDHRTVMLWTIGAMSAIALGVWLLAPWIISLLATDDFAGSVGILRILLLALPLASFSTLMAVQWIARGFFWRASIITLAMGALSFGLNLVLIPRFGATGAAWSMVLGFAGVSLVANAMLARVAHARAVAHRAANGHGG